MLIPRRLMLLASVAMLIAGCATPDNPQADAPTANAAASGARPVRECRYSEGTGSNMRRRICATQEEWAAFDAAEQEQDTDDFFRRAREGATAGGNVETPAIGGF